MIIPVRCFTCNKVIGDKWTAYVRLVEENDNSPSNVTFNQVILDKIPCTAEFKAMEALNIKRMCCRRHFLTTVDLMEKI
jgi:DNA-directed RNA polymerase I, II, and III subunit RPABC5